MTTETWVTIGVGVAILGFLWSLHRDMADLRERMTKLGERMASVETSIDWLREVALRQDEAVPRDARPRGDRPR